MTLQTVKAYLELVKPRVSGLLAFSGLTAGLTAYRMGLASCSLPVFTLAMAALTLGIFGANAVTCYIDRDIDALMERTRHRPLPSKRVYPPWKALAFGLTLSLPALTFLATLNLYSGLWFAFGLADSTIIYNLLTKRKTPWNIILGAPAGGAPAMAAWSAVSGQPFHPVPFLMAALIVLWTPAHIWSLAIRYAEDYRRANVPMLPALTSFDKAARCIASTTLLLPLFSTLLGLAGGFQPPYHLLAQTLNVALIFLALKLVLKPSEKAAWKLFKFTSPYLAVHLLAPPLFAG